MLIKNFPAELQFGFTEIKKDFPHIFKGKHPPIQFIKAGGKNRNIKVFQKNNAIVIEYAEKVDAFRGFILYLSHKQSAQGFFNEINEHCPHKMNGSMLDVSRNGVYTIYALKKNLVKHALLGLNMMILYTEDTFEVKGEPFFGYMRGRYSEQEIKEIDAYAAKLGIEMFPCIQTLGHLEQVLQWPTFHKLRDTDGILMASEDSSLAFIEKMIDNSSKAFKSKRIHLGMDEAIGIGSGFYRDRYGAKEPFEILSNHLKKVSALCEKKGLKPMIWSDMYFRLGSKTGDYYDLESKIPKDVIKEIPKNIQMVYWDYYNTDVNFYRKFIQAHRKMNRDCIMATGIWTWSRFWAASSFTFKALGASMAACRQEKVEEVFATLWRDDGSECVEESSLPGFIFYADSCFNDKTNANQNKAIFKTIFKGDWDDFMLADNLDYVAKAKVTEMDRPNISKMLLWQDPVLGHLEGDLDKLALNKYYKDLHHQLNKAALKGGYNQFLDLPVKLSSVLAIKAELHHNIKKAVLKNDTTYLKGIGLKEVTLLKKLIKELCLAHRKMWYRNFKPFGFEILEVRYGGMLIRLDSLEILIKTFLKDGETPAEFLVKAEPVYKEGLKHAYTYRRCLSASRIWTGFNY
jgi:hexosaminidase